MPTNGKKNDSWRKSLKAISHCPVCGRDYKSEAVKLFDSTDETRHVNENEAKFVHFTCDYCRSYFMAMLMIMPKGMSVVGMVTDLNLKDVQKLRQAQPLTVDEMIEGHKIFNSLDFKKLLLV